MARRLQVNVYLWIELGSRSEQVNHETALDALQMVDCHVNFEKAALDGQIGSGELSPLEYNWSHTDRKSVV